MSVDETSPPDEWSHPAGEEWEAEMRAMLEDGDYDAELGMQMAKDAQRLVAGEITEDEFHDRYHEAVVEEFGEDDRPLEITEDIAGEDGLLPDPDDEENRREVLKKSGAVAGALSLGMFGTADQMGAGDEEAAASVAEVEDEESDTQLGMVIDLNKCDGCLQCVTACADENNTEDGANWMYVFTYEDEGQDDENFLVRTCQHCSNAPCKKVCPTTARHKRTEDGLVLTDYDVCIGCRYCQVACPYGVNYFQWGEPEVSDGEIAAQYEEMEGDHIHDGRGRRVDSRPPKGVMGKCTMCPTRQDGLHGEDKVGTTACEEACQMDAVHFGDMNDPDSDPQQYLDRVREENPNDQEVYPDRSDHTVSTFRLLEEYGTDPNVVFVGNEPSPNAEQVEGPVTYDEIEQVDRRKEVLDDGTFGGGS